MANIAAVHSNTAKNQRDKFGMGQVLPFQPAHEVPNKTTLLAIAEADDMEKNPQPHPVYHDIDALMDELLR